MEYNQNKDGETPRKQTLENANSKEVRGLRINAEIYGITAIQHGIELTVFELMKGLSKKYPEFDNLLGSHWDIPEVIESIISVFEEMLGHRPRPNENPDAGMEERERLMAEGKDD